MRHPSVTGVSDASTGAPEIVRADPRMRRQALVIVVGGLAVGAAVIGWGLPWLEEWVRHAYLTGNTAVRRWVCIGAGAGILALGLGVTASGVNMIGIGRRVLREGRFPPSGLRVLRDTPVRTGPVAAGVGRIQGVLGGVIVALALILVLLGGWIVVRLWP